MKKGNGRTNSGGGRVGRERGGKGRILVFYGLLSLSLSSHIYPAGFRGIRPGGWRLWGRRREVAKDWKIRGRRVRGQWGFFYKYIYIFFCEKNTFFFRLFSFQISRNICLMRSLYVTLFAKIHPFTQSHSSGHVLIYMNIFQFLNSA